MIWLEARENIAMRTICTLLVLCSFL